MFFTQGNLTTHTLTQNQCSFTFDTYLTNQLLGFSASWWLGRGKKRTDSGVQIIVRTAVDISDIVRLGIVMCVKSVYKF